MKATNLSRRKASLLLSVHIYYKLRYLPVSMSFTKRQCPAVNCIFWSIIMSKMGFNWRSKLEILHLSHNFTEMQIPTCWDLQESLHTSHLVGHTQVEDLIRQYMQHISDFLYLHIGLQEKVFTYNFETIKDIIP